MRATKWNTSDFEKRCKGVGMDRLEKACWAIADEAKRILRSKIKGPPITRPVPPGRTDVWMERTPGAMVDTIRVVRRKGDTSRNVWIMAGNYKTWWAKQMEYGRGGWKGGAKSFLRPALRRAKSLAGVRSALESGAGETTKYMKALGS